MMYVLFDIELFRLTAYKETNKLMYNLTISFPEQGKNSQTRRLAFVLQLLDFVLIFMFFCWDMYCYKIIADFVSRICLWYVILQLISLTFPQCNRHAKNMADADSNNRILFIILCKFWFVQLQ